MVHVALLVSLKVISLEVDCLIVVGLWLRLVKVELIKVKPFFAVLLRLGYRLGLDGRKRLCFLGCWRVAKRIEVKVSKLVVGSLIGSGFCKFSEIGEGIIFLFFVDAAALRFVFLDSKFMFIE